MRFARLLIPMLVLAAASATRADDRLARIDAALDRAARYLVAAQQPSGAWASDRYGVLRGDEALTAHVLKVLFYTPGPEARAAFTRGVDHLAHAKIEPANPAYTAAQIAIVLSLDGRHPDAVRQWCGYLRDHQFDAAHGWSPADAVYGGWGYSPWPPQRGRTQLDANISATLFALGAMRFAGVQPDDPAFTAAAAFIRRCQNADGGFCFAPADAPRNKAGADAAGRFHSYGSATADGLRALRLLNDPADAPRIAAARGWLEQHFDPAHVPGVFNADRQPLRDAYYFYYAWSVAHAFTHLGVRDFESPGGGTPWAAALADELLARQRADGSWSNRATDAMEDEPLIATPFAAAALSLCRISLVTHSSGGLP